MSEPTFATATRSGQRSPGEIGLWLLALICAVVASFGVARTMAAGSSIGPALFLLLGLVGTVVCVAVARAVHGYESYSLRVDSRGITVERRRAGVSYPWDELDGVAFVDSGGIAGRTLVLEPARSATAAARLPRSSRFVRSVTGALPLATVLPLRALDHAEADVRAAIQTASGGRFPDSDRAVRRLGDPR